MIYARASRGDLPQIAEACSRTCERALQARFGSGLRPRLLEDLFRLGFDSEPGALLVAREGTRVVGFVFAPARPARLGAAALLRGRLLGWAWTWLRGGYGARLTPLRVLLGEGGPLLLGRLGDAAGAGPRILALGVLRPWQRRGVGRTLLAHALDYLARQGARRVAVRLRPEQLGGLHLFRSAGFTVAGRGRDRRGPWVVMTCEPPRPGGGFPFLPG